MSSRTQSILLSISVVFAGIFAFLSRLAILDDYNYSFWLISYQRNGFLRRALPGSVLAALVPGHISRTLVTLIGIGIGLCLIAALSAFAIRTGRRLQHSGSYLYIVLLLMVSPILTAEWAWDISRQDQMVDILFLGAVGLISWRGDTAAVVYTSVIAIIMGLIHEIAFFVHVPAIIAIAVFQAKDARTALIRGFIIAIPALVTAAILLQFGDPHQSLEKFTQVMNSVGTLAPSAMERSNATDAFFVSTTDKLLSAAKEPGAIVKYGALGILYLAFVAGFSCIAWPVLERHDWSPSRRILWFAVLLFPEMPLFFLGIDWSRWLSNAVFAVFVVWSALSAKHGTIRGTQARTVVSVGGGLLLFVWLSSFLIFPDVGAIGFPSNGWRVLIGRAPIELSK